MTTHFNDINQAAAYYAKELLSSSAVESTNDVNSESYKKKLGGEITQEYFMIDNPTKIIGTWKNHKPYKWWMYGEIISEMLNLEIPIMYKYMPEMFEKQYELLPDGRMQYTYASRFSEFNQLVNVYKKLKDNPNSKRAVVDIYTPYDSSPDRADAPCTTMYHFIQRDEKLNMSVFYRSWDFFGGFKTYDLALSSFILQSFASWLNFDVGKLGVYANSLHYYNRDRGNLEALVKEINENPNKKSKQLVLDEKIDISNYYKYLRDVKVSEEAAYNGNYEKANEIKNNIPIKLFQDMSQTWINKNEKK